MAIPVKQQLQILIQRDTFVSTVRCPGSTETWASETACLEHLFLFPLMLTPVRINLLHIITPPNNSVSILLEYIFPQNFLIHLNGPTSLILLSQPTSLVYSSTVDWVIYIINLRQA
ncbi:hypothetical protein B9Z19DRAFT_1097231 [Tuber borchii]|uniref:Uncharacterized protein n=1 Tax=Tuber borchii TaxID=42251 RepID=A0A2T6ZAJ1_TUBBO|nr:hypothetical protein B9Z19DRAFT_1097231 [Tuber borchii]